MTSDNSILGKLHTGREVIDYVNNNGILIVDLRFIDLIGTVQHFSIPASELTDSIFELGTGFDGSSVRGFQAINESDMLIVPDPETAFVDPVLEHPTLALMCDIKDPITGESYSRDPRYVARKAEQYLKDSGIATVSYWGPEVEFFIFDNARFDYNSNSGYHFIDSEEGIWNSGRDDGRPNLAHRPRHKEGYFPLPPVDSMQNIRTEIILKMMEAGLHIDKHHHEVATAGQNEIGLHYGSLVKQADAVQVYKYIVKNVALANGKTATFMPKPLFNDNGTGMHTHQSLWDADKPLFYDKDGYAEGSETMFHYIGGLLKHARAVLAFAAPSTNSYKRLVPGFEAPTSLAYSRRNRSAAFRIPMYEQGIPATKRVEFRAPDPMANTYLAFSAMLMAGLDGIRNKIDPGDALDQDIYDLTDEELAAIPQVPGSLEEALQALEQDHDFLLEGDVFTKDVIDTWIEYKTAEEADQIRLRPHSYEYFLYFDG